MRGPGVHCECVKKVVFCVVLSVRVRGRNMWCRLLDLVVSPGLLSLSGDLTTRTVAYAYMYMYNNINNDNNNNNN